MPGVKKAELIEGVVYMPSPVSAEEHGEPHFDLNGWLFVYRATPHLFAAATTPPYGWIWTTNRSPMVTCGCCRSAAGRRVIDGYVTGAPS